MSWPLLGVRASLLFGKASDQRARGADQHTKPVLCPAFWHDEKP
ncbi:hypothetical protein [Longimycelium tulufanense]|nr:hypothetical protein [Longimycelium tulufanense]